MVLFICKHILNGNAEIDSIRRLTMEFTKVGNEQITLLMIGTALFIVIPIIVAITWTIRKKERFSTVIVGALTFLVFAIILEKPIQNVLVFPVQMGLAEHGVSRFINARPVLWAFIVGLFPGVFEETGRLVAYKSVLKNRNNKETSISYGIGHGGFEVMLILGLTFITYISYSFMINAGTFNTVVDQVLRQAPDQADQIYAIADKLATFSVSDLAVNVIERISAVLYHIGASIMVFYACRERKHFWLYPLAILIHTLMDGSLALTVVNVIDISEWVFEGLVAVCSLTVFFTAYLMLYKKDKGDL